MRYLLSITLGLVLTGTAIAEPQSKAASQPQPCHRSDQSIHIAGIDLDAAKCHYAVALQKLSAVELELVDRDAQIALLSNDLADAKEREKALADELAKLKADKPASAPMPNKASPKEGATP